MNYYISHQFSSGNLPLGRSRDIRQSIRAVLSEYADVARQDFLSILKFPLEETELRVELFEATCGIVPPEAFPCYEILDILDVSVDDVHESDHLMAVNPFPPLAEVVTDNSSIDFTNKWVVCSECQRRYIERGNVRRISCIVFDGKEQAFRLPSKEVFCSESFRLGWQESGLSGLSFHEAEPCTSLLGIDFLSHNWSPSLQLCGLCGAWTTKSATLLANATENFLYDIQALITSLGAVYIVTPRCFDFLMKAFPSLDISDGWYPIRPKKKIHLLFSEKPGESYWLEVVGGALKHKD